MDLIYWYKRIKHQSMCLMLQICAVYNSSYIQQFKPEYKHEYMYNRHR